MGMTIGANWNGARAFTATSGPGVSLMSEFIGLAYFAEVPTVLFNVQREVLQQVCLPEPNSPTYYVRHMLRMEIQNM